MSIHFAGKGIVKGWPNSHGQGMKKDETKEKKDRFFNTPSTRAVLRTALLVELYKIRPDAMCAKSINLFVHEHLAGAPMETKERIVTAELQFLTDLNFVSAASNSINASMKYRLLPEGVLHVERELWSLVGDY
ncbi:hypothetical protein [Prosthecobacter sp.]|uniref:hypothetical protein n=1 Tax=Prosthecobacter sp. TaxID=1965333 RepID=UPI0037845B5B